MITLPPGFDYSLLVSDLFTVSLPFIVVGVMILSFVVVAKTLRLI
jgi:hypothetical protein